MIEMLSIPSDLAVVPIFVNAGAAILPAILGALASGIALLFKPRQWLAVFRRRPWLPIAILAMGLTGWFGGKWLLAAMESSKAAGAAPPPYDWAAVGRAIVNQRLLAAAAGGTTQPSTKPTTIAAATGLGGNFARTSYDGGVSPLNLIDAWSFNEPDTSVLASAAVVGDRVYSGNYIVDTAGKFGALFALSAKDGRPLWNPPKVEGGESGSFKPFFSSPAISADGKSLVIGQGLHDSADCTLICLDTATGKIRWQAPTPLHLESSPAILGDLAVIGAGAIEDKNHKPIGDPGFVLAVQISTGKELWRYPVIDPESSPAIGEDGTVYIGSGFNGNAVVALRIESDAELSAKGLKREIWKVPSPYPVTCAVTLAGDLVVVGAGNSDYVNVDPRPAGLVMAIDRKSGQVKWKVPAGDSVLGAISYLDGKLICPVRSGHVMMLDAQTGQEIWKVRFPGGNPVMAGCAFTGTHVYAVSNNGWLAILDAKSGQLVERVFINQKGKPGDSAMSFSTPVVAGGRVFVGSETGGLRCFAGQK